MSRQVRSRAQSSTSAAFERFTDRASPRTQRAAKWMAPGMGVKRWFSLLIVCVLLLALGFLHFTWTGPLHFTATRWILWLNALTKPEVLPLWVVGAVVMVLALAGAVTSVLMLNRTLLTATGTAPESAVEMIYSRRTLSRGPHLVALGGGTGLSNLLAGLKVFSSNITAVVAATDDGGSSGRLRATLDMIAPGDLVDCYAALSDSPVLARLLLHRFTRGDGIEGHTFGNLLLATLSEEQGGLAGAMSEIHSVLNVRGQVFPATTDPATLVAELQDGDVVRGESQLHVERAGRKVVRMSLEPPDVSTLPQVTQAIVDAELIVIGPGSLLTSLIPAVMVPGVAAAIRESKAPLVYVANVMTEPGETDDLSLEDHERLLTQHVGRSPDWVLVNSSPVPVAVRDRYAAEGAKLLAGQRVSVGLRQRLRYAAMLHEGTAQHDPRALAVALIALLR